MLSSYHTNRGTEEAPSLLSAIPVAAASSQMAPLRLTAGIAALDRFLEGGLGFGSVSEWGVPWGRGGRELVLAFLASITRGTHHSGEAQWVLWINSKPHLKVYPPAWQSRGVALERMRFAQAERPLSQLKPAFLEPLFKMIVLDSPSKFSRDDCAFLARQARLHGQVIVVLRDYLLSPDRGNVWAKLRLNAWHDYSKEEYVVHSVRGISQRETAFRWEGGLAHG